MFPNLRKTRGVNLALGVFGQIKSQSGFMSESVREVPGAKKHKHRLKRLWRFLSNPRVKPEGLRLLWVTWCFKTFVPDSDSVIKVAMDWTTLPGDMQCLMIAIPFHGRAIPLVWQIILHADIKDSQNLIEERLVARLVNLTKEARPEKKLLLTADRGFGRASFIQFLLNKHVFFVLRVKSDVIVTTKQGKRVLLRRLGETLTEGVPVWFAKITYRGDGVVTGINMACVVAKPEKGKDLPAGRQGADPWFLVTNLRKKETAIARYYERFHIEEWFKDLKHRLGIASMQTRNLMRVRRMLFIAAVAYGITMLVGTVANRLTTVRDSLITGGKKSASRIWFALKIIRYKLCKAPFWQKVYIKATVP